MNAAAASKRGKKKHKKSEMSNIATKAPTIQTMHGRMIIKSTLIPLSIIDKSDYRARKTLESSHTAMTTEAYSNSRHCQDINAILLNYSLFIIQILFYCQHFNYAFLVFIFSHFSLYIFIHSSLFEGLPRCNNQ